MPAPPHAAPTPVETTPTTCGSTQPTAKNTQPDHRPHTPHVTERLDTPARRPKKRSAAWHKLDSEIKRKLGAIAMRAKQKPPTPHVTERLDTPARAPKKRSAAWHKLKDEIERKLGAIARRAKQKPPADKQWSGTVGTFDLTCPYNQYSIPKNKERWKFTIAKQQAAEYNITELKRLEQTYASEDTNFARSLKKQLGLRGQEPVTRSSYNLPQWLEWLAKEPDHDMASQIYIRGSRGIDITEGVLPPRKHLKNHVSTKVHQKLCDTEITRLLSLSYITEWSKLRKLKPHLPVEPRIIMPMQAIYKKQKLRIVVNATAAGLNTIDIKGRTKYTTIQRTLEAISTHCYLFRLDVADCFLLAAIADKALELCCIRWRGITYCYLALFFGSRIGPLHIQNLNTWWLRHSMRTIRSNNLAIGKIPEFEATPPINRCQYKTITTATGQRRALCILQNLGLLLDDVCGVCSGGGGGLRAAWFAFETIATVAQKLGICISPKTPEKSCPPTKTLTYLGLRLCTRTQKVSLEPLRIHSMQEALAQVKAATHITKHQMQSLVGTLSFAAIAIEGPARAAYRLLLDTLRQTKTDRPNEKIEVTDTVR